MLTLLPEEVVTFKALASLMQIGAGDVIFKEADNSDYVYFIEAGTIKIYRINSFGKVVTVGFRRPGDLIGLAEVLVGANRYCFAQAVEASKIWRLDCESFINLLDSHCKLAVRIAAVLGRRLRDAETTILNLVTLEVDCRLAKLLIYLTNAGANEDEAKQGTDIRLTHQELAEMIGTSRQTVTTTLQRFKDEKLIFTGKRYIEIADWDKLNSYANQ